jgi:hypothetical protein
MWLSREEVKLFRWLRWGGEICSEGGGLAVRAFSRERTHLKISTPPKMPYSSLLNRIGLSGTLLLLNR